MANQKNNKTILQKPAQDEFQKLKFLFVSLESLSGDLAWHVKKQGCQVKAYIKARKDVDVYNGFIEKVNNWKKYINWADIIVFDDVEFGKIADQLRKKGKLVIGGSEYTDKLEMDREFGQLELKKYGVNTLPQWHFSNYDEAAKFVRKNPGRYVFKPSGNTPSGGKNLLFLGEEEDGKDLLELLEQNKDAWQKKAPTFQLQSYISGVEIAVGAFFNGKDFIYPINVNFEHKRMFPGDLGPFTGEMGCYDEKTEVLTKDGWKYFKDLTYKDKIATLNPKTNQLKYHQPLKIVVYNHHKKMIQIKNQTLDILVTPGHNMWVQKRYKSNWEFIRADEMLTNPPKIARTAKWQGKRVKNYVVPEYIEKHRVSNSRKIPIKHPSVVMSMNNWLRFLGIFLAEGSLAKNTIVISQSTKKAEVKELLKSFPFKITEYKDGFRVHSVQLFKHLESYNFGKCDAKHVPDYVKFLSKDKIKIFLDAYALGDATVMRGGWRIFYTSSKRMADDIQELFLKIGRVGIIKKRNRFGKKIKIMDHWTEQKHNTFEIIERGRKEYSYLDKRDTKIINYHGKVYCATVPHHIMYVRRNGKPYWCGNTLMYWSEPNKLFKSTLEKMKPALAESGYVGYIDLNCIVNSRGIYPLEFTSRFGYPTIQIQLEGILTPPHEWLARLARHEKLELKTKKGFQIGVRILLPTYFSKDIDLEMVNTYKDLPILFKRPNLEGIHIEDIKLEHGTWRVAGTSGCVLVVTGSGTTVAEARKQVYLRIQNLIIPHMFYRTDIGQRWFEEGDKLKTWGYL